MAPDTSAIEVWPIWSRRRPRRSRRLTAERFVPDPCGDGGSEAIRRQLGPDLGCGYRARRIAVAGHHPDQLVQAGLAPAGDRGADHASSVPLSRRACTAPATWCAGATPANWNTWAAPIPR
ncbi:hypothetical protein ACIRRA_16350 [Nocardia sp. NPDC101769]|uniref:hypothetical protein n=1 Tax=Nocardia sp. NPDC101769 TaxID=3364333 RepID=UPI00382E0349